MGKPMIVYKNTPTFSEWLTNFYYLFQALGWGKVGDSGGNQPLITNQVIYSGKLACNYKPLGSGGLLLHVNLPMKDPYFQFKQ